MCRKKCFLLGRKAMTNLESILKSRHLPRLANKGAYSLSYGFSSSHIWMWELDCKEDWMLKSQCFWIIVLEKILENPLDWKRSNQSILGEINPEYSLEGLMLKLKLWYFGHLMTRANSLEKTLMLGKIEDKRRREQLRMRWLNSITDSRYMNLSKLRETVQDREAWHAIVQGVTKSWSQLSDWKTTMCVYASPKLL